MDPALYSPSISPTTDARPYSTAATFWTTFVAGPAAGVLMQALNARLVGKWARHRVPIVIGSVVALAAPALLALWKVRPDLAPGFFPRDQPGAVLRLVGFLVWGALYLHMRPDYAAAEMHGTARDPWRAGFFCGLISLVINLVLSLLAMALFRRP